MVVYYINKKGECLADYPYPIKEGDICMLYDGEVVKTIYIDNETETDSIWRDFRFVDTKSLKGYHFPTMDSIICAPFGNRHAIGNAGLLMQLIQECKGEWLLDFLNETSAVLSGFVDFWDLEVLRRMTGDDNVEVAYDDEEALSVFFDKYEEDGIDDDIEEDDDTDVMPVNNAITNFCLAAITCLENQMDKRSYRILYDTLKGNSRREIAEKHHLTQERIRQIVVKATKQAEELLIEQHKSIEDAKVENTQLNYQLKLLKEEIVRLQGLLPKETITCVGDENEELSIELISLLETPITDITLPVRATNILQYMGVKKFADIPQISSSIQILKERNSGKKTVHDISRMLEDFHLTFGMSYAEIVKTLKVKEWHSAKRAWIREGENTESIKKQKVNDNNKKEESTGSASNEVSSNGTQSGGDKRIGYTVRLFPSQREGEIVNVRVDGKGIKKLVVRTLDGSIMAVDDMPYLYEVLKKKAKRKNQETTERITPEEATVELTKDIIEAARTPNGGFTKSQLAAIGIDWPPPQDWIEEKVGTKITPTQLEVFNRIEYANPSSEIYKVKGSETYKDVASSMDDRRKMKAILQAMTHFYTPATPRDIARTISRTAWGDNIVREETVDTFLKLLPEVEYIKWGKYILKSRSKHEGNS